MKLSKENLQFIDTYLLNSNVVHTDVRLELTDHVASAIEKELTENTNTTFYQVFKQYMVENKTTLLGNTKKFANASLKKTCSLFLRHFISFKNIVLLVFLFGIQKLLLQYFPVKELIISLCYLSIFLYVVFMLVFSLIRKKIKYSSLDSLLTFQLLINYIFIFPMIQFHDRLLNAFDANTLLIVFSVLISIMAVLLKLILGFKKEYKLKYN
jgi:hypothetical protein